MLGRPHDKRHCDRNRDHHGPTWAPTWYDQANHSLAFPASRHMRANWHWRSTTTSRSATKQYPNRSHNQLTFRHYVRRHHHQSNTHRNSNSSGICSDRLLHGRSNSIANSALPHSSRPSPWWPLCIASLYVMLTRYRIWSNVTLLRSLWSTDQERRTLIDNIYRKIHHNANLMEQRAELQRLGASAESTLARHPNLYDQAQQYTT